MSLESPPVTNIDAKEQKSIFSSHNFDVLLHILAFMDFNSLHLVRTLFPVAEEYVRKELGLRFARCFGNSLDDKPDFLEEIYRTGAVIGGDSALAVLYPDHPTPSIITIYVPRYTHEDLVRYLRYHEDFDEEVLEHHPELEAGFPNRVDGISRLTNGTLTLDLVRSTEDSALLPILSCWTVTAFAYITPQLACVAYPELVQRQFALLNPLRMGRSLRIPEQLDAGAIQDWRNRGWTVSMRWSDFDASVPCAGLRSVGCAAALRFFGDRWCIRGRIGPAPPFPQDVDSGQDTAVVWWRGGYTCSATCHRHATLIGGGARCILVDFISDDMFE